MLLIFLLKTGFSQSDTLSNYGVLEVKKLYSISLSYERKNGKGIYKVNNKKVRKATYDKYKSNWNTMITCKPCIIRRFNTKEKLLSEGIAYTDCGAGWFRYYHPNGKIRLSGQFRENHTGNWENAWKKGNCGLPVGQWVYYNKKGDTLYSEFWDEGQFTRQVPEQNKTELWDMHLMLNGVKTDTMKLTPDQIPQLTISAKYKNSHTYGNDFEIECEVSALNHKSNKVTLALSDLKSIDIRKMLSISGIPANNKAHCTIAIFHQGEYLKRFSFDLLQ